MAQISAGAGLLVWKIIAMSGNLFSEGAGYRDKWTRAQMAWKERIWSLSVFLVSVQVADSFSLRRRVDLRETRVLII